MTIRSTRRRLPLGSPGDITVDPKTQQKVRCVRPGEWEPWVPEPWNPYPLVPNPQGPDPDLLAKPLRCDVEDGWHMPYSELDQDEFAAVTAETPEDQRADGWTAVRRRLFLERLASSASVQEAARSVGMTRQSARKLYRRAPAFRAAWDEALRESVAILAETAFHRAIHGTEQQVYYQGRLVGTKDVYHDRLLMYLLRVRDPLNYAPVDELDRWQKHRGLSASARPGENAKPALTRETSETSALPGPRRQLGKPPVTAETSESSDQPETPPPS